MTKVYFRTYGCALNQSDSEVMAGLLKEADFEITSNIKKADVVIVNTCTVKGPSESKFMTFLDKVNSEFPNKKVVITGCIAQTDPEKLKGYPLVGTSQINNIVEIVEEAIHDTPLVVIAKEDNQRLGLPKLRRNKIVAIIPICEGCLGDPCSYCKVKAARGGLRSYFVEDILKEVRLAVKDGCKEIWLTAQDTGCYGKDIGTNLPSLLEKIVEIGGDFKIRLGMLNPNHALEYLEDLAKVFTHPKMFKFLHIPVQAGNNLVLQAMRRKYDSEDMYKIAEEMRKAVPEITLATDFIVGFPGESEEQFDDSIRLMREIKFDVVNISKFWPREKTEAAEMENQVPGDEIKRRSTLMSGIFNNISRMQNERWLGWEGEVLVDEVGKPGSMIGRNFAYKPVVVGGDHSLGDKVEVKIKKISNFDLRAI